MVMDALKGYVQLATGLTEVTAAKARDAASALVNQGMQWTVSPPMPWSRCRTSLMISW